jgi:flagellar basal-body rod modification protein FlgD
MAIETVDIATKSVYDTSTTRTPSSELGKDDFLLLLTEQLKNQDPMNPMDNMDFISQMSSFSSLEQMLNMNETLEKFVNNFSGDRKLEAMRFLGTTVTAKADNIEEPITGVVEMVGFNGDEPYLKIGEYAFAIEDVQLVSPTYYEYPEGENSSTNSSGSGETTENTESSDTSES